MNNKNIQYTNSKEYMQTIKIRHIQTLQNCYCIFGSDLRNLSNTLLRQIIEELDNNYKRIENEKI